MPRINSVRLIDFAKQQPGFEALKKTKRENKFSVDTQNGWFWTTTVAVWNQRMPFCIPYLENRKKWQSEFVVALHVRKNNKRLVCCNENDVSTTCVALFCYYSVCRTMDGQQLCCQICWRPLENVGRKNSPLSIVNLSFQPTNVRNFINIRVSLRIGHFWRDSVLFRVAESMNSKLISIGNTANRNCCFTTMIKRSGLQFTKVARWVRSHVRVVHMWNLFLFGHYRRVIKNYRCWALRIIK